MTFFELVDIAPYSWSAIGSAAFCGALIGMERQLRGKPVGIRTSVLIILGTYLFLATAFMLHGDVIDHSRVVGQIITGIGFLGAGVMLAKDGAVVGVTSAATIWVLAFIPKPPQNAEFSVSQGLNIKALLCNNGSPF